MPKRLFLRRLNSSNSRNSTCSRDSSLSSSVGSTHEVKIGQAFEKGDVDFLVAVLGALETLVGFLRIQNQACVRRFLEPNSNLYIPEERLEQHLKDKNSEKGAELLTFFFTVSVRRKLDPCFQGKPTPEAIEEMLEICGGETMLQGDKGVVLLFAECCRRQSDEFLLPLCQKCTSTPVMFNVLHARSTSSKSFCITQQEKKVMARFCKTFLKSSSILQFWADGSFDADEDVCCIIL